MEANGHKEDPLLDWDEIWNAGLLEGEVVTFPEALVVAPAHGRLRREQIQVGDAVTRGLLLCRLERHNGAGPIPLVAGTDGVFLGWLAWEGESVAPGSPLAHIARNGSSNGTHAES